MTVALHASVDACCVLEYGSNPGRKICKNIDFQFYVALGHKYETIPGQICLTMVYQDLNILDTLSMVCSYFGHVQVLPCSQPPVVSCQAPVLQPRPMVLCQATASLSMATRPGVDPYPTICFPCLFMCTSIGPPRKIDKTWCSFFVFFRPMEKIA